MGTRVVLAVLVLVVCTGGQAAHAPAPVLALTGGRLVALDPATLAPRDVGPAVPEPAYGLEWARSPDGSMTAVVPKASENGGRLVVVAAAGLRVVSQVVLSGEDVCRLSWPTARRMLLVMTRRPCYGPVEGARVLAVDPLTAHVVSERPLLGRAVVVAMAPSRSGLALLVGEAGGLRLLVVTATRTRSVALPGVRTPARPIDKAFGSSVGLAVDPDGRRAYVVEPGGRLTEVDVGAGTASTVVRALAGAVKGQRRAVVQAVWIRAGVVAVTGARLTAGRPAPAGLVLVDTRRREWRLVDPAVSRIAYARGTVLAYQPVFTGRGNIGLRAYTTAGVRRFQVASGDRVDTLRTQGRYAYAAATGGSVIVDLRTGGTRPAPPGLAAPYSVLAHAG